MTEFQPSFLDPFLLRIIADARHPVSPERLANTAGMDPDELVGWFRDAAARGLVRKKRLRMPSADPPWKLTRKGWRQLLDEEGGPAQQVQQASATIIDDD